jgi:hypothetical protein
VRNVIKPLLYFPWHLVCVGVTGISAIFAIMAAAGVVSSVSVRMRMRT